MTGQPTLFDAGPKRVLPANPCTPYTVGSGPEGERCGTCRHLVRHLYHTRRYLKCGRMRHAWTHGAGSDIKAKWPACRAWRPRGTTDEALRRFVAAVREKLNVDGDMPLGVLADLVEDGEHGYPEQRTGPWADRLRQLAATDFDANTLLDEQANGSPAESDDGGEIPF